MSVTVLADTGPLYPAVDPSDQYHQRAQSELARLAEQDSVVVLTAPVLIEAYTLISRRLSLATAHRWLEDVNRGTGFLNPTSEDYVQAMNRIRAYNDQPFTMVDSVIAVLSERLNLPVWTYDHHFDIMRVARWS